MTSLATILVDYENVSTTDGLKGVEYLNETDTLIIFYSQCCEKIRAEYIEMIEKSRCEFKTYKLARTGKNALDFYIAVECGVLGFRGENQISIISKDKGFSAVLDFFQIQEELDGVRVRVASNVENAIVALNATEDDARKQQIKENRCFTASVFAYTGLMRPLPSVYITGLMPVMSSSISSGLTSKSARV